MQCCPVPACRYCDPPAWFVLDLTSWVVQNSFINSSISQSDIFLRWVNSWLDLGDRHETESDIWAIVICLPHQWGKSGCYSRLRWRISVRNAWPIHLSFQQFTSTVPSNCLRKMKDRIIFNSFTAVLLHINHSYRVWLYSNPSHCNRYFAT